jgi:predicted DNA-binding transcriptional regulator AlpA
MNQPQPTFETLIASAVAQAIEPLRLELQFLSNKLQPQKPKDAPQYLSLKQLAQQFGYGYTVMRRMSLAAGFPKPLQAPCGDDGASKTQARWKLSEVQKYIERMSK